MQLVILIILAGVIGYFIAKSRLSKPIDDAGEKVTQTTRNMADKTEGWVRGRFGRKQETESEQEVSEEAGGEKETEVVVDEKKPAKKQTSRRKTVSVDKEEESEEVEP